MIGIILKYNYTKLGVIIYLLLDISFSALKFNDIENRNYFKIENDSKCLFKQCYYLPYVWWLEMGNKNIKNVPTAEYDVYWRIKIDNYTKPLMFHCSVLVDDKVYVYRKGILNKNTIDTYRGKWCIYKTNSITLPKQVLDNSILDTNTTLSTKTMNVKCTLFNLNHNRVISDLYVDCFHLVPKDCNIYRSSNQDLVYIDEIVYDPYDTRKIYADLKEEVDYDYFKLLPGIYDYDDKLNKLLFNL